MYASAGIPEKFIDFDITTLVKDGRSKPLWETALAKAAEWKTTTPKGLLIAGSQGAGKSLALWLNARAAVKSWLTENPPENEVGTKVAPFFTCRFKTWLRDEFYPSQDGKRSWNFELRHAMLNSNAIFLDDLTLDASHEAFRPVKEFIELLTDDLSTLRNPPSLWITTNNSSDDLAKQLGEQVLDRLCGPKDGLCEIIKCNWESYR